ncbi:MAG: hypothetical protein U0894_10035 [Pirellulales bacterium]
MASANAGDKRLTASGVAMSLATTGCGVFVASTRGPIANCFFDTSGRRIENFLDDPSILDEIESQRIVYVTDVAEKSALTQALRTNPFVQSSGNMSQVQFLHGYDGEL